MSRARRITGPRDGKRGAHLTTYRMLICTWLPYNQGTYQHSPKPECIIGTPPCSSMRYKKAPKPALSGALCGARIFRGEKIPATRCALASDEEREHLHHILRIFPSTTIAVRLDLSLKRTGHYHFPTRDLEYTHHSIGATECAMQHRDLLSQRDVRGDTHTSGRYPLDEGLSPAVHCA